MGNVRGYHPFGVLILNRIYLDGPITISKNFLLTVHDFYRSWFLCFLETIRHIGMWRLQYSLDKTFTGFSRDDSRPNRGVGSQPSRMVVMKMRTHNSTHRLPRKSAFQHGQHRL